MLIKANLNVMLEWGESSEVVLSKATNLQILFCNLLYVNRNCQCLK